MGEFRPLHCPAGVDPIRWSTLAVCDPGLAAAEFLATFAGVALETEGPNRGPLLREWAADPRLIDGQPYCGTICLSLIIRLQALVPVLPGRDPLWHNRRIQEAKQAWQQAGLFMGYRCAAPLGSAVFWSRRVGSDPGAGGHMDFLLGRHAGEIVTVGPNLGDTVKIRRFALDEARALGLDGFGLIQRA